MPEIPANIEEFNMIAGLIFAQLYGAFPVRVELIDRDGIAKIMGIGTDWSAHKLTSGRSFSDVLNHTISWLTVEDYINSAGSHTAERVALSSKGLAAMNAVPAGLKESVGTELSKAVAHESTSYFDISRIGKLIGGIIGGYVKSSV